MKGHVDEQDKALLSVEVYSSLSNDPVVVEAWVDTAFDGHFVFSTELIKELALETLVETDAILADGSKVAMQTYVCCLDWFGQRIAAQVIENEGKFPLLGTSLLSSRKLHIDYEAKTLDLL